MTLAQGVYRRMLLRRKNGTQKLRPKKTKPLTMIMRQRVEYGIYGDLNCGLKLG